MVDIMCMGLICDIVILIYCIPNAFLKICYLILIMLLLCIYLTQSYDRSIYIFFSYCMNLFFPVSLM